MSNSGKVILVTGASSGIGKAISEHLHLRGYKVYGTQRKSGPVESGINMITMNVDNDQSVHDAVNEVYKKEGRIDAVINNAGWTVLGSVEDTSLEEAKAQFETNFFGVLRICKSVLPFMRNQKNGYIINISSLLGTFGGPFSGLYSASKFAVEGMSEALRLETEQFGVRVVLIEPGDFKSNFTVARKQVEASKTSDVYKKSFDKNMETQSKDEAKAPSPEVIALLVERILNTSKPKLRYSVGMKTQRIIIPLKKYLPQRLFDAILHQAFPL